MDDRLGTKYVIHCGQRRRCRKWQMICNTVPHPRIRWGRTAPTIATTPQIGLVVCSMRAFPNIARAPFVISCIHTRGIGAPNDLEDEGYPHSTLEPSLLTYCLRSCFYQRVSPFFEFEFNGTYASTIRNRERARHRCSQFANSMKLTHMRGQAITPNHRGETSQKLKGLRGSWKPRAQETLRTEKNSGRLALRQLCSHYGSSFHGRKIPRHSRESHRNLCSNLATKPSYLLLWRDVNLWLCAPTFRWVCPYKLMRTLIFWICFKKVYHTL